MTKNRLEAFSDGVIAIIITIMVLELELPHAAPDWGALRPLVPEFLSYVLSFVFVGVYWNNHHHLTHTVHKVTGGILWANLHLLFWMSLIPFATGWVGTNDFASAPVAAYGVVLLMSGTAYWILTHVIISRHGSESLLAKAVGRDRKGLTSLALYAIAIPLALFHPPSACAIYVAVAVMWLVPDRRIEKTWIHEAGKEA